MQLELSDAGALFHDGTTVRLRFTPATASGADVEAGIALPPGLELMSGMIRATGPFEAGKEVLVEAKVRAAEPGTYVVRGWATGPRSCVGGGMSNTVALEVSGDATSASAHSITPPNATAFLDVKPNGTDAGDLSVHVTSTEAFPAIVCIMLDNPTAANPNALQLKEGNTEWHGQITVGDSELLRIKVAAPVDGHYVVRTSLLPHASVTTNAIEDYLQIEAHDGRLSIAET